MKLTAHQIAYLPWLGLFDKIAWADQFVVFDSVQIEDSGFENRNRILSQNGPTMLTVPIRRSRDIPSCEVEVATGSNYERKHWRSIELAYQRAPHWGRYAPDLHAIYQINWVHLADLDIALLRFFLMALDLRLPIRRASDMGLVGTKSDLVLDMCVKAGATEYMFGAKGRDYADVAAFTAAGIKVQFQDYKHPTYPQMLSGFAPNMSVIDLLMNVGPDSLKVLRNAAP